jgi:hypothetical protein
MTPSSSLTNKTFTGLDFEQHCGRRMKQGITYPFWEPDFTPVFCGVRVCRLVSVLCYIFSFVSLLSLLPIRFSLTCLYDKAISVSKRICHNYEKPNESLFTISQLNKFFANICHYYDKKGEFVTLTILWQSLH